MAETLRILMLEDSPADAKLVEHELLKGGIAFEARRVDTREDFERALGEFSPDLILSDYMVPSFGGPEALDLVRRSRPDLPFVFVSGQIEEEPLLQTLQNGALDYIQKDRLGRLAAAVRRALEQAKERSARRKLEEQIHQAQKLESVGRLAGGVAHDFSNLLTVISGYAELLLGGFEESDPRRADVEEIKKTVYRAASLTRQLLAFSKKQMTRPRVLDLNAVVSNMEKMLRRLLGEDIALAVELDPALGRILADEAQLEQVLLNLAVNARDAMASGGRLTLRTANADFAGSGGPAPGLKPGRYVTLCACDTGCGMDPETQSHIFEPFFTTKQSGTGLGLATVYGILRQSAGHVEVESAPGRGTCFRLYFPSVAAALEAAGEAPAPPPSLRGEETILLVDDEPSVRALARRILAMNGYAVLEASNEADAERLCREHPGPVALLLTDVVMPTRSGPELSALLSPLRPEMKTLFISGYADDRVKRHKLHGEGRTFLQKPFTPADLLRKVRALLGPPKTGPGTP